MCPVIHGRWPGCLGGGENGGENDAGSRGALMSPGENCLSCHSAGGSARERPFSVAGTVYGSANAGAGTGVAGASVMVVDAQGVTLTLTTNAVGNFYSSAALTWPLQGIYVERNGIRQNMPGAASSGACRSGSCRNGEAAQGRLIQIWPRWSEQPAPIFN